MRVYYMTTFETAADHILPERRLRIGQLGKLNDPFELLSIRLTDATERKIFSGVIKHWQKKIGVLCFGPDWKSPLMWAHYARSHTGICLGFDIPDALVSEIDYRPRRQIVELDETLPVEDWPEEMLLGMLSVKFKDWAYEKERRVFVHLTDAKMEGEHFYCRFGKNLVLREIILGARFKKLPRFFQKIVEESDDAVTVLKARAAFNTFTMVQAKAKGQIVIQRKAPAIIRRKS